MLYTFKFDKKEYKLEDKSGKDICKAKLKDHKLLRPDEFEFKNKVADTKETHDIGKTTALTVNWKFTDNSSQDIPLSHSITFDGENIWQFIEDKGYTFSSTSADGKDVYTVKQNGNQVATITWGKKPEVETDLDDPYMVFIICFAIAKISE